VSILKPDERALALDCFTSDQKTIKIMHSYRVRVPLMRLIVKQLFGEIFLIALCVVSDTLIASNTLPAVNVM
jgi:hypothetical protein